MPPPTCVISSSEGGVSSTFVKYTQPVLSSLRGEYALIHLPEYSVAHSTSPLFSSALMLSESEISVSFINPAVGVMTYFALSQFLHG